MTPYKKAVVKRRIKFNQLSKKIVKLLMALELILISIKDGINTPNEEKNINLKKIKLTIIIKIFANIRRFLGL